MMLKRISKVWRPINLLLLSIDIIIKSNQGIISTKMRAQGIRKCLQFQKELLDTTWNQVEPSIRSNDEKYQQIISWCNIYENGKFKVDFPLKNQIFQWSEKLNQELTPGNKILLIGFVKNPPNSKKDQYWHIDYRKNVDTIFIPMVDQGCETATQIIQTPINVKGQISPLGYQADFGRNILDLMDKENADFLKVVQIVCRSHSIIRMLGGTVHRGIANRSNEERILFFIHTCPDEFELTEEPIVVSGLSQDKKQH